MATFRIGDKVKLINVDARYTDSVGTEGIVSIDEGSPTIGVTVYGYYHTWHREYTRLIKENNMSSIKYYRNLKDNFLWLEGAVLSDEDDRGEDGGYAPVSDLWNKTEDNGTEYISRRIVESPDNKDMFERVYPIGKLEKMVFGNKETARAAVAGNYKTK